MVLWCLPQNFSDQKLNGIWFTASTDVRTAAMLVVLKEVIKSF
jgi:hypothetical protein